MNPAVVILISILTVTGGIAVYDTMIVDDPTPAPTTGDLYAPLTAEDEALDDEPVVPEPALRGVGFESVLARLDTLERENAALKALLAESRIATMNDDGSMEPASGGGGGLELPVVYEGDEAEEAFDEDFLRSFRVAMEKVEADRREERVVDGLTRQLERLGVNLSEDQQEMVIEKTMEYRSKTREMWRELPRGSDDESREARRNAFEAVREEYSTTIYSLVPTADAEKIVDGMGRGIGFSTRRMRGARGRGNR